MSAEGTARRAEGAQAAVLAREGHSCVWALGPQTSGNPGLRATPCLRRLLCHSHNKEASRHAQRLAHMPDPSWLLVSLQ